MVVFTFSVLDQKQSFWKNWSKISILFVQGEISCLDRLEYAEFIGGVHCLGFRLETLFWANFDKAKSKLLVSAEVWHQDYFEYAEFNGGVHFFTFKW